MRGVWGLSQCDVKKVEFGLKLNCRPYHSKVCSIGWCVVGRVTAKCVVWVDVSFIGCVTAKCVVWVGVSVIGRVTVKCVV